MCAGSGVRMILSLGPSAVLTVAKVMVFTP